jgi:Protein of unknown function (DUF1444)
MEREPGAASDYGVDLSDLGDEPAASIRDAPPDILSPIDASAPVSGHVRAPDTPSTIADAPEQSWDAANEIIFPALRAPGTQGLAIAEVNPEALAADASRSHSQPLIDEGPVGLAVVYVLHAGGFDVIVNGDHLLSWGVSTATLQEAAMRNLAQWSATAPWTDEVSGERRLISSDTGDGWDASRALLPEVLERLTAELGATGRILVGVPERHLLVAGALRPGDDEFAGLFADFVVEASGGADEPVDRRVFELVDGRLVELTGLPAPAAG